MIFEAGLAFHSSEDMGVDLGLWHISFGLQFPTGFALSPCPLVQNVHQLICVQTYSQPQNLPFGSSVREFWGGDWGASPLQ